MSALVSLQLDFKDTLLTGDNRLAPYLNNTCTSDLYTAVEIYKNAYQRRLIETLQSDYPMLEKLLGTESFDKLAVKYMTELPSSSFTLRNFGQHLSTFLKKETVYQHYPYLAEMADFEWQLTDVFDLSNSKLATVSDMNRFKAEDWPHLTIKYHASVRWLALHWNIIDVYQAIQSNSAVPDLVFAPTAKQCLIWRKQYSSYYRIVDARESYAMKVMTNSNFTELCQTLTDLDDSNENSALDAARYLKTWLSADLIASIELSDKGTHYEH
ncbi:MAG: putative DNA-binding domain-containing protein [Methylococcales bacterium]|nr:putative DNA-binding domain-containing protein [Methylococcales bacterium]